MAEKIGSGRRFRAMESSLAAKGARNPAGLAAHIGRQKYGSQRFQKLAEAGKARRARERANPPPEQAPPRARRVKV
jgi:hypothetical protein